MILKNKNYLHFKKKKVVIFVCVLKHECIGLFYERYNGGQSVTHTVGCINLVELTILT